MATLVQRISDLATRIATEIQTVRSEIGSGGGGSSDPLELVTEYSSTQPTAPASGVKIFARAKGRRRPGWTGPSGHSASVQSLLGANKVRWWTAQGNATAATAVNLTAIVNGTATARNVASSSVFAAISRIGYVQGTAAVGAVAGVRHNVPQFFRGDPGDPTGAPGGFETILRFGIASIPSTGKGFMGMPNTGSSLGTSVPANLLNCLGVGFDEADTTFSAYCNDGSGAATKVDFGAAFPAKTMNDDFYEARMFVPPYGDMAVVSLENLKTGAFAEVEFTTNLPAVGVLLAEQIWISTGSTSAGCAVDVSSRFIETDH